MAKQGYNIPFAAGLDLKTDPNQVDAGKLLELENAVFRKGKRLEKRAGFPLITTAPDLTANTITTLNDGLIAVGTSLQAFDEQQARWLNQGPMQAVDLRVEPTVRLSTGQDSTDSVTAANGTTCTVYTDETGAWYQTTGQNLNSRVQLPATSTNPRVFILGNYFAISFLVIDGGIPHIKVIVVPSNGNGATQGPIDISSQVDSINAGYDGIVANNQLYLAWDGSDGGDAVRISFLRTTLTQGPTTVIVGAKGDRISLAADTSTTTPIIYVTYWSDTSNDGFTASFSASLVADLAPVQVITSKDVNVLTTIVVDSVLQIYYEVEADYAYAAIPNNSIECITCTDTGTVSSPVIFARGVGLAAKAFTMDSVVYLVMVYQSELQPTYFITTTDGTVICKLAYSNGAGYMTTQVLPSVTVQDDIAYFSYLIKSLLQSVNRNQNSDTHSNIYTQTGVNLAIVDIRGNEQLNVEISGSLHFTGGYVWQYDGVKPIEHNFHLFPDNIEVTTAGTGGDITAQDYFYIVTYEWTDAAGMLHRSTTSIPYSITTTGATSANTLNIPMLRLTAKDDVRIVIYRWSTAQQAFYQVTSVQSPELNDPSTDYLTYVDTLADEDIIGNNLLYITGGVVENVAAPAASGVAMYRGRVFVINAENRNQLIYSKQVLQGTPVEFSDLFSIYVAPTLGAQGSTGEMVAVSSMDDKLIIFKRGAIYYITGNGPLDTGIENDFSEPIFITATAGCIEPRSVVLTPQGIMFKSDKGIWLLGRDLNTTYIGAGVDDYNSQTIVSALCIPETNEVRFNLENGAVLMYDYYYGQWGTFTGIPAISACLQNNLHTFINRFGQVYQEQAGTYLDGTRPVLLSLSTSWIKLTDLQGFQRVYFMYLLGEYLSPHALQVQVAYDYNESVVQSALAQPLNTTETWGGSQSWGSGDAPWGGGDLTEQFRVFFDKQKCQAIRITINEVSQTPNGAGLTLSGLNFVVGGKATYPKLPASNSVS